MTSEDVVLVAARAVRATQAAEQHYGYSCRRYNSEGASVRKKPMDKIMHVRNTSFVFPKAIGSTDFAVIRMDLWSAK